MPFNPYMLRDTSFEVEDDEFAAEFSQLEFAPNTPTSTWTGLTPDSVYTDTASSTWVLNATIAQDWEYADSFSNYCYDNEGETKSVVFRSISTGAIKFTANVVIVPVTIGGTGGSFATSTFTMPVKGKPVKGTVTP